MFFKTGSLKNVAILIGKHLCWGFFFKKLFVFKKETPTQVFPVDIVKFLRTFFYRKLPMAASESPITAQ